MTAFQQKSFSVAQSGRSPDSCGHGWLVRGRCWYCGVPCDCRKHEHQVCGVCQGEGGKDALPPHSEDAYSVRKCRGHWHIEVGEFDIDPPYATEAEAQAEADRRNAEWSANHPPTPPEA